MLFPVNETHRVVDFTAGNPETVSTDFDESDRLYFEELSHDAWDSDGLRLSPDTRCDRQKMEV
jgi:hypothetical protein